MEQVRELSIALYSRAAEHARERGVILADTSSSSAATPRASCASATRC